MGKLTAILLTLLGAGLLIAGVAILSIATALIVAGVLAMTVGLLVDWGRE